MIRRLTQLAFLALILSAVFLFGSAAERWCPFGGIETLHSYLTRGQLLCSLAVSNLYALAGVVLMTILLRRAFCSHLCPIGTITEFVGIAAKKLHLPTLRVPKAIDRVLSMLKYAVLAIILYFTWKAGELVFRTADPCYALISRHGSDITFWAYVVSGVILVASLFFTVPFCRWLCPLAAILNPLSRFAPTHVVRSDATCSHCNACSRVCPYAIDVARMDRITAARCTSCLNCVRACPSAASQGTLSWQFDTTRQSRRLPKWLPTLLIAVIVTGVALADAFFQMPSFIHERGIAPARTETLELNLTGLSCRGKANLLVWFVERDDDLAIAGYVKLDAWPSGDPARIRLTFDPTLTSAEAIRNALTQPSYNADDDQWTDSPFSIVTP